MAAQAATVRFADAMSHGAISASYDRGAEALTAFVEQATDALLPWATWLNPAVTRDQVRHLVFGVTFIAVVIALPYVVSRVLLPRPV